MKKFIVLYHAPVDAMEQTANASPEEQAKGMQEWMNWAQRVGDKLVDMGQPLFNGQSIGPGGVNRRSESGVSGYSIMEAENLEEAKSLLEGHPHISGWHPEATIELHEAMPIPGMM